MTASVVFSHVGCPLSPFSLCRGSAAKRLGMALAAESRWWACTGEGGRGQGQDGGGVRGGRAGARAGAETVEG